MKKKERKSPVIYVKNLGSVSVSAKNSELSVYALPIFVKVYVCTYIGSRMHRNYEIYVLKINPQSHQL